MAELFLAERSALEHRAIPGRLGPAEGDPGVTLREMLGLQITGLLARHDRVEPLGRATAPFGFALPKTPETVAGEGYAVLWNGPEQWLVVAEPQGRVQAERLVAACAPHCMSVDVSDGRAAVSITGPKARDVLAKGLPIDLHPRAFKPGDVALTLAGGLAVNIRQVDATPRYDILVARSYAESFWHWLTEAAAEYGATITR